MSRTRDRRPSWPPCRQLLSRCRAPWSRSRSRGAAPRRAADPVRAETSCARWALSLSSSRPWPALRARMRVNFGSRLGAQSRLCACRGTSDGGCIGGPGRHHVGTPGDIIGIRRLKVRQKKSNSPHAGAKPAPFVTSRGRSRRASSYPSRRNGLSGDACCCSRAACGARQVRPLSPQR